MSDWKIISKRTISDQAYNQTEEWLMELPNGQEYPFLIRKGKDAVIVFGITSDQKILIIHQYYVSAGKVVPSLVAGVVDKNDTLESAIVELREEAGCTAKDFVYLGSSYRGKYITGSFHYYLAKGIVQSGKQDLEKTEDITVSFVSVEELKDLLKNSKLQDVAQVACAYLALDYLNLL
jgi:ADP-ribose pyrophosphatase